MLSIEQLTYLVNNNSTTSHLYPGDLWRHCGGLGREILMPYPINQRAHQFNSIQSVPVSFGLWYTALKFLSPGPRNDVTDHLDKAWNSYSNKLCGFPMFKRFLPWYESDGSLVSHYIPRFLSFLRPWPQQQTAPPGRSRGIMSRTDTQDIHLTGQNEYRLTTVYIGVVSRCGRFLAWTYLLLDEGLLKVK